MIEIQSPPIDSSISRRNFLKLQDGQRLHFVDSGHDNGSRFGTLILLHSAIGNASTFKYQFNDQSLSDIRVVAYDRRGHGQTPALHDASDPSPTDDLLELIDSVSPDEPVHLLGTAAGGRIATDFAREHPRRISTLMLVCSLAGVAEDIYPEGTETLLAKEFLALPPYLKELGPVYRGENPQGTREWQDAVSSKAPSHISVKPSFWVSSIPPASSTSLPPGLPGLQALEEAGGPNGRGVQIHLITGDADPYATPAAYARLAAKLPASTLTVLEHSGHSPYWEQPQAFNSLVRSQLGTTGLQGAIS